MATYTIANNESLSGAIDLGLTSAKQRVLAIIMPAAWTAANLTFQGSLDDVTYTNVYDDAGNEVTVTAAAARYIVLDNDLSKNLTGFRFMKVRSGTSGSAVNQGAARTIVVHTG